MLDYCFISGDSFEEDNFRWSPTTGQLIANNKNLGFDTFAKGGQGNLYILQTIMSNIKNKDYKLACISWSSSTRQDYITAFGNWQVQNKITSYKDSHFSENDQILFESLICIHSAQHILERHNIPYVMWWGIGDDETTNNPKILELYDLIESKNTFYKLRPDKNGSVYQFAKNINQLDEVDNNHPNKEAHRRWSKLILKFMDNCTFSNTNFEVNEDGTKINDKN